MINMCLKVDCYSALGNYLLGAKVDLLWASPFDCTFYMRHFPVPHPLRAAYCRANRLSSALASCVALPPPSLASCRFVRLFVNGFRYKRVNAMEGVYSAFARRLYGCSRLIMFGTNYLAKSCQLRIPG